MNTSVGTRPGVFMSTADTLSWVTRPLACERALSPGVWPAVHGSHTVRMVIAAPLVGIDGEVERRGGGEFVQASSSPIPISWAGGSCPKPAGGPCGAPVPVFVSR